MNEKIVENWYLQGGKMVSDAAGGDIDKRLSEDLDFLRSDESGWALYYRHRRDGTLWKMTYHDGAQHGGGPRTLERIVDSKR